MHLDDKVEIRRRERVPTKLGEKVPWVGVDHSMGKKKSVCQKKEILHVVKGGCLCAGCVVRFEAYKKLKWDLSMSFGAKREI